LMFTLLCATVALQVQVTPVQKVIQMMQDMVAKGKQEKHEEQVAFATFKQWCADTSDQKARAMADGADQIEQLSADIQKAQADQLKLGDAVKQLQANIATWNGDKSAAQAERAAEKADFDTLHTDYSESISALGRAIDVLSKRSGDTAQSLLQLTQIDRIPASTKRVITAFLASEQPLDVTAPQANAYEFQSGGIVEMLEKLEQKFKKELHGYEKDEAAAKHEHEMLIQELDSQLNAAEKEASDKTKLRGQRKADEAQADGDLAATKADLAEDTKYRKDLITECDTKAKDFEARQSLRKEELEAVSKAIEILASGAVSGNADKHLPSLAQTSLAILRGTETSPQKKMQLKASALLQKAAVESKSRLLSLVSNKVASDPFAKVKKMIKDMIVKLMEEATEEAEHKGWCDTELSMNGQTREDKSDQVSTLTARSEELSATISKLSNEITELSDGIAAIDKAMSDATALREEEKAKNAVTVQEAQEAQEAVAQALQVLKEFYDKAAGATALVQGPADDAPGTFSKPYQGMGGSAGGVVGMIEVIQSDFARLEAETSTAESEAAAQYQKLSDESSQDKAVKQMDLDNKDKDRTNAESDLTATKQDLEATQAELDAALAYYEKLKPSCVDAGLSYEDRVKQRAEEIESLQMAAKVLDGNDIA